MAQRPPSQQRKSASRPSSRSSKRPGSAEEKNDAVASLSESELQELREIFSLVDKDGGGTISKEELGILMATLGLKTTKVFGQRNKA